MTKHRAIATRTYSRHRMTSTDQQKLSTPWIITSETIRSTGTLLTVQFRYPTTPGECVDTTGNDR